MSKEKQIKKIESNQLIEELSKMPPMVIATAYLHAINYTLYGVDVTEKWLTATQQAFALESAHRKAYYDAMQRQAESKEESKTGQWIPVSERLPEEGEDVLVYVKGYDSCGHYEDQLCYAPDGSIHISGECKHGECDKCKWNLTRHFYYYEVAAHFNEPTSFSSDGWLRISEEDEVIAWMPLPDPYQSDESVERS